MKLFYSSLLILSMFSFESSAKPLQNTEGFFESSVKTVQNFFQGLFASSSSESTLQYLESLSDNPLYFNIPITEYRIVSKEQCSVGKDCSVYLEVDFTHDTISVVTDRPIRETDKVDINEFMTYVTSKENAGLVFSLSIREKDKVVPTNFMIKAVADHLGQVSRQKASYNPTINQLAAKARLNVGDDDIINQLNTSGSLIGDGAILSVEG